MGESVLLLLDGLGKFMYVMGVSVDLSDKFVGLGVWLWWYVMLVDDGVVKMLYMEEGGVFISSGVDDIFKVLFKCKISVVIVFECVN